MDLTSFMESNLWLIIVVLVASSLIGAGLIVMLAKGKARTAGLLGLILAAGSAIAWIFVKQSGANKKQEALPDGSGKMEADSGPEPPPVRDDQLPQGPDDTKGKSDLEPEGDDFTGNETIAAPAPAPNPVKAQPGAQIIIQGFSMKGDVDL